MKTNTDTNALHIMYEKCAKALYRTEEKDNEQCSD